MQISFVSFENENSQGNENVILGGQREHVVLWYSAAGACGGSEVGPKVWWRWQLAARSISIFLNFQLDFQSIFIAFSFFYNV